MEQFLYGYFQHATSNFGTQVQGDRLWETIRVQYSQTHRVYHNLNHIYSLVKDLVPVSSYLKQPDAIYLAAFFHDIVYFPKLKDNELQSAIFARTELEYLSVPRQVLQLIESAICATQTHIAGSDTDIAVLIDADLAILGKDAAIYAAYAQQIRKEYAHIPEVYYRQGRRKVLERFLARTQIYSTPFFYQLYETSARTNILEECKMLL
ncbi:MAG: hypothetical protein RIS47_337 [Bacteroidota bacterium]